MKVETDSQVYTGQHSPGGVKEEQCGPGGALHSTKEQSGLGEKAG